MGDTGKIFFIMLGYMVVKYHTMYFMLYPFKGVSTIDAKIEKGCTLDEQGACKISSGKL